VLCSASWQRRQDDTVKLWCLRTGACLHSVRNYSPAPGTALCLAADDHFLFVSGAYLGREDRLGGAVARNVHAWVLPSTTESSPQRRPRFACVLEGERGDGKVGSLAVIRALRLVVVWHHGARDVALWRYDTQSVNVTPVRRLAIFKDGLDSKVPPTLQVARDGRTLFINTRGVSFRYSVDEDGSSPAATTAGDQQPGWVLCNCATCGVYDPARSKTCSACHSARFCDDACLRRGWRAHRPACLAARALLAARATAEEPDDADDDDTETVTG